MPAITRLGTNAITSVASTAISGTLPAANINDTSISNIAALPAGVGGKVLQVVSAYTQTQATSNSSTYADTGLTANITPSSTSNKILVLIQQSVAKEGGNTKSELRVYRGATEIGGTIPARGVGYTGEGTSNFIGIGLACSILDTPNSTSTLTYKTQFNNADNTGTIRVQVDSGASYITLIEIAG